MVLTVSSPSAKIIPDHGGALPLSSIDLECAPVGGATPATNGAPIPSLTFTTSQIIDLAVHPTKKFLAVLCNNTEKRAQAAAAAAAGGAPGARNLAMMSKPVNCIVKMIDLSSARESRQYAIQTLGNGEPVRMALDPSGLLLAISFSDKSVLLLDWYSGAVLTTFYSHSLPVSALCFTADCRHLLTTGMDGVVGVWKLEEKYVKAMLQRKREMKPKVTVSQEKSTAVPADGKHTAKSKSTAMLYLDSDSDEEEPEKSSAAISAEEGEFKENEPPPAAAVVATVTPMTAGGLPLPPLHSAAEPIIGRPSAIATRSLPTWARSTVVSPEAGAPSMKDGEVESTPALAFPSGMGVGTRGWRRPAAWSLGSARGS